MADTGRVAEATVRVDAGAVLGPLRRIWTSHRGFAEMTHVEDPDGIADGRMLGEHPST